jgi:hypothetical protein
MIQFMPRQKLNHVVYDREAFVRLQLEVNQTKLLKRQKCLLPIFATFGVRPFPFLMIHHANMRSLKWL